MKTEKEIKERIKDLKAMLERDPKNQELYNIWLDGMYWVLEATEIEENFCLRR